MGERNDILSLWQRARRRGERVALATVVRTEGSSYRKPGARMLITASGERAGTVSGGCLEGEISRKIWWLTAEGPVIQQYRSSFEEDAEEPSWGLGCGGTVWVHLEQEPASVLRAMVEAEQGLPAVIVFALESDGKPAEVLDEAAWTGIDPALRGTVLRTRESMLLPSPQGLMFVEYLAAPPRLTIFGAGDDSIPIAEFAARLGWRLAVADGRAHLLRNGKFPPDTVRHLLTLDGAPPAAGSTFCDIDLPLHDLEIGVQTGELAVVLTHSYKQDRAILRALLPLDLQYLGILGPRHRTMRLLQEIAPTLGWSIEQCFARLHSPVGLDLGGRDPAAIALSIVADLQAVLTGRRLTVNREAPPAPAFAAS